VSGYFQNGLFRRQHYPIFENNECLLYVYEYVPFHIPQIVTVFLLLFGDFEFVNHINGINEIRMLDLGSGPATIPLALLRFLKQRNIASNFKITTLEASNGFCKMINIFKKNNSNPQVNIIKCIKSDFNTYYNVLQNDNEKFDWIIMSNFMGAIGQNKSFEVVDEIFSGLVNKLIEPDKFIILTIIEGNNTNFFDSLTYLRNNLQNFKNLEIIYTKHDFCQRVAVSTKYCLFYSKRGIYYKPYINTKTLILKRR